MAKGVNALRTKTVVRLAALEAFLDDLHDPDSTVCALVSLLQHAAETDAVSTDDLFWVEELSMALEAFFLDEFAVSEYEEHQPKVALDLNRGALELLRKRHRPRRQSREERSFRNAVAPVRVRQLADRVN